MNSYLHQRKLAAVSAFLQMLIFLCCLAGPGAKGVAGQQARRPPKNQIVELSADGPQRHQGDLFIADDNVEVRYGEQVLHADHVEYNDKSYEALVRGHVQYDFENQHIEADQARYNVSTGRGSFENVRGMIKVERRANPAILVTENPLYFEARDVEKFGDNVYFIRKAWVTVCEPQHPKWQFYAPRARIRIGGKVVLLNANFRLLRIPLIWAPYADLPAASKIRQSGFLVPVAGNSTAKGFVFGDAFYWSPLSWMDTTLGAELFSRRGWAERGQLRMTPWENTSLRYDYFGVIDRQHEGGHQQHLQIASLLPDNWRFVADVNELSSLTFRLTFADTFSEAINSEVPSSIFLTHNFKGFSLNFASLSDRSFLTINPQTSVFLRDDPEARFGSVEQAPWHDLPAYFGFDSLAGAVHRADPLLDTPNFVSRAEFAPRVTVPFHFGLWLNATATAAFRSTYYGDSLVPGSLVAGTPIPSGQSISRNDGEFSLDLRLPTLERFFDPRHDSKPRKRYKHTIEPQLTYNYVTGINNFLNLIRFDADATLTDTNEIQYGLMQRLWSKTDDDQPQELASWSLVQKHYFDPTFGGAIIPGQRNVFRALDSVTPFAFAFGPRNSSPLVSDFKITPGGALDTEQILEYDPQLSKITVIGALQKIKPYREFFATVAYFRLQADPILQPLSNQVRFLAGYGSETRRGFNFTTGISYDFKSNTLQNELYQVSYNGNCCGLAVAYQHVELTQVQTDNRFRIAFIIANIGSFGNLRHQEHLF